MAGVRPGGAGALARRSWYRVEQFAHAVRAGLRPLDDSERDEVQAVLPETAWPLFWRMPLNDQRHSLGVLRTLRAAGHDEPALMQAALLHDCAKGQAGVRLWHRVAVVLVKAFRPGLLGRWTGVQPSEDSWQYPLWAHVNHPAVGAGLAAAAGCDPLAIALIRHHHDHPPVDAGGDSEENRLGVILHAADEVN